MKRIGTILCLLLALAWPMQLVHASENTSYHWGFKKSKNGQQASINEEGFKDILDKNGAVFIGDKEEKALYLTFDNGYENGYTAAILDILKKKQVPATFFVTGHYVKDQPELLKQMVREGHIIGNHSWSHPDMTQVPTEKIKEELERVKAAVQEVTGQKEMYYLRPPRGIFSERTLVESYRLGYINVFWSLAYKDWEIHQQKGWKYAYASVMAQLHPGAIILLHSVSKDNANALEKIIDDARQAGYEFKSLDDLLMKQTLPRWLIGL